ncbi:MAG: glycosyltransferase family 9 protein [Planctomycetota bacterium]
MNLGLAKVLDRRLGGLAGRILGGLDRLAEAVRPPRPVVQVRRILIVKFWGLGNWALLRPVVHDVRRRWPAARIVIVTLEANLPLVQDLADEVLCVRPRGFVCVLLDLLRGVARLRGNPPDLGLDFEFFSRAGSLLARLAGVRQRVGFRTGSAGRDDLYTVLVPFRSDAHVARSFRDLVEAAGVEPGPYRPGGLSPSKAGLLQIEAAGLGARPYVVLHPGSGDNFRGRRWSAAGFAAVGRMAREHGHEVVVTGSRAERALTSEVVAGVGRGAVDLAGRMDVEGLVAVLAGARALVSNDTGPVHLASALGVRVLAIYGPNTPRLYGPLEAGSRAFYRSLPCSPCITAANYRSSRCRIHTCMMAVATGEVCAALERLLAQDARAAPNGREGAACATPPS